MWRSTPSFQVFVRNMIFVFIRSPAASTVLAKTRDLCFKGSLENAKLHVMKRYTPEQDVIPGGDQTYANRDRIKQLSATKLAHLEQMFKIFIPEDRQDSSLLQ